MEHSLLVSDFCGTGDSHSKKSVPFHGGVLGAILVGKANRLVIKGFEMGDVYRNTDKNTARTD